jgi:hypothetical protein
MIWRNTFGTKSGANGGISGKIPRFAPSKPDLSSIPCSGIGDSGGQRAFRSTVAGMIFFAFYECR